MRRQWLTVVLLAAIATLVTDSRTVRACPFCSAVSQTLTEEILSMDVVVVARLEEPPPPGLKDVPFEAGADLPKAKFRIVKVIRGESSFEGQPIETIYFGAAKKGSRFLVMGVDPPAVMWSTPLPVSARSESYVEQIIKLPKEGPERLKFFQQYLEDAEDLLARDSYDEFARAPYATVKAIKDDMDHDRLIRWIRDPEVPASRRRLYLTMLGVCGTAEDLPLLEELLSSTDRRQRAGLDAMIACYLTLKGADGMPLVEKLFLANKDAEYADTYAAIMALRFHGTEGDVIPRQRILEGFHYMLERPKLADLVIPDLARWEDWSVMDRLVTLFKQADEKSSWVRVPVVNYLRACPLPEAKAQIEELKKIDPVSVRRASSFFPFGPGASSPSGDTDSGTSDGAIPATPPAAPPASRGGSGSTASPNPLGNFLVLGGLALLGLCGLGFWMSRREARAASSAS